MDKILSIAEAQSFAEKLEEFGDNLSPKEQLLLSQILLHASAAEGDVIGHAMALPAFNQPWTELRKEIGQIVLRILEEYGRHADITGMTAAYPRIEN